MPSRPPDRRAIAEVFDGRELVVIRFSFRPLAAIKSTQVVDCHIRETALVFPFDADRTIRLPPLRIPSNLRVAVEYERR
jgi:hypothetical protein